MSFSRVWLSMNRLSGSSAVARASCSLISPASRGCRASSLIRVRTGAMITTVRKKARPSMIWLAGAWDVPMACRRKPSTMVMRVKQVSVTRSAGASESSVIKRTMRRAASSPTGPCAEAIERVRAEPVPVESAAAVWAAAPPTSNRSAASRQAQRAGIP